MRRALKPIENHDHRRAGSLFSSALRGGGVHKPSPAQRVTFSPGPPRLVNTRTPATRTFTYAAQRRKSPAAGVQKVPSNSPRNYTARNSPGLQSDIFEFCGDDDDDEGVSEISSGRYRPTPSSVRGTSSCRLSQQTSRPTPTVTAARQKHEHHTPR